ncbi:MAG TPA: hypothetical protein VFA80_02710 [Xanthobacteraceae bacterium]|nr:hypothetical protein [Xanthobacteraceae bacterium]
MMTIISRCCVRATVLFAAMASALLLSALVSPAAADSVRWSTVVGLEDANNAVGNIAGGGQPWTTLGGFASVDLASGRVEFEVRGLVLAGGNTIGTPGAITQVMGTVVCDAGSQNLTFNTPLVTLSPRGDAQFVGIIGPIAASCTSSNVAFLIRIAAGRWIANGAVRNDPAR